MLECLGEPAQWAKLWKASGRSGEPAVVPIIIHEDGVPHFQGRGSGKPLFGHEAVPRPCGHGVRGVCVGTLGEHASALAS